MKLPEFKLETYFQKWEFKAPYQFCNSDMETLSVKELLSLADPYGQELWDHLHLGYTEVTGAPPLRDELHKLYTNISPQQILTFTGGEEGIFAIFHSLLTPQDHVVVVTPCYQSHLSIPQALGCSVSELKLDFHQGWKLDLNHLQTLILPHTKMIVVNFPHNPTGVTLSHNDLLTLIDIARKNNLFILSDEAYRFSELEKLHQSPPLAELYSKAISLGVLSKAFGLAGLRIGWIATQNAEILQKMNSMKHYLSICGSGPSEVLATIALRAKEKILTRNHQILKNNLTLLDQFFKNNSAIIRWIRPTGGCAGFPELLLPDPIEKVAAELAEEEGVLILPGSHYDWPGNFFRMGFGRINMPIALEKFENFLHRRIS